MMVQTMSETNGFATRDTILARKPRRIKTVEIPGWGKFRIRSLTELERSRFEATIRDKSGQVSSNKMIDLKCRLIVLCVVDGNGDPLLNNSDIEELRQQDSMLTNALVEEIQAHCGYSDADLGDLEKNLEPTPAASSQ
jgi:hypothetical protein